MHFLWLNICAMIHAENSSKWIGTPYLSMDYHNSTIVTFCSRSFSSYHQPVIFLGGSPSFSWSSSGSATLEMAFRTNPAWVTPHNIPTCFQDTHRNQRDSQTPNNNRFGLLGWSRKIHGTMIFLDAIWIVWREQQLSWTTNSVNEKAKCLQLIIGTEC